MRMCKLAILFLAALLLCVPGQALATVVLDNGMAGNDNFHLELGQGLTETTSATSIGFGGYNSQVFSWDVFVDINGAVSRLSDSSVWTETESGDPGNNGYSYLNNSSGLVVQVDATLGLGSNVLTTNYNLYNSGSTTINNISLFQYLDPDLSGDFYNDAAIATVGGETMLLAIENDSVPSSSIGLVNGGTTAGLSFVGWEIGNWSSLRVNILGGSYDLSNSINGTNPFDLAMALQYDVTSLYSHTSMQASTELVANPTPEPGTLLLLGSGMMGLAYLRKRKKA